MTKTKRVLALLCSLFLCFSLCGCAELDRMQAAHGTWTQTGGILWNGYEYTRIDGYWEYLNTATEGTLSVTAPDVPVLLSGMLGEEVMYNSSKTLLHNYTYDDEVTYCRKDLVEWLVNANTEGYQWDTYRYNYWDEASWKEGEYSLTAAQMQAVDTVLQTVEPIAASYEADLNGKSVFLKTYSQYDLLAKDLGQILYRYDDTYWITVENMNEPLEWSTDCYEVPAELYPIFEEILRSFFNAQKGVNDTKVTNGLGGVYL